MDDVCEGKEFSFPKQEENILQLWSEIKAFETQLARTKDKPEYIFYDGPPFATGLPHYGHILAGTIKDIVTRYQSMTGHHVTRRFGWDCHGLPVENEIDKKLGIKKREDVLNLGIDKYNEECRSIVTRYVGEWEKVIARTGRWIDFKNDYKTMDLKFMESCWWVFGQLYEKGLVYKSFKVMPYSTGCKTPLSNFEAGQVYKDVPDPEIMVAFPVIGDHDNASFVAWTTTPWTLPSNLALCVNANFTYVKVRNKYSGKVYVVAESRLAALPNEKPKTKIANGSMDEDKKANPKIKGSSSKKTENVVDSFEVLEKLSGASLVGMKYEPIFNYFIELSDTAFRVVADNYVTDDSGTGIVHSAPAFGEDDFRVCRANQVITEGDDLVVAVDDDGCFTKKIVDFSGRYVKDADKDIIESIKAKGRLVKSGSFMHSYPFCWRSNTPLIYRAFRSWFIRVEKLKEQLLQNNKQTCWVPDFVKEKRFHNWLENARDWAVSRSRFWGTPLPIWISNDGEEIVVMDSVEKLEKLSGVKVFDLHRHNIDHITIPSKRGPEFGVLRRVDDVFDCWFESGSMPYAYIHYPFENVELFEKNFPGHFVAEGLDQTRGCFFALLCLLSLCWFPSFKNHAIRKAHMGTRILETLYPISGTDKKNVGIWTWIMNKLGLKSNVVSNVDEKPKEFVSNSLWFPWHLMMSTDDDLLIMDRRFQYLWTMDLASGTIKEVVEGSPKVLEICEPHIKEKVSFLEQIPCDWLQQQKEITISLDKLPYTGLVSSLTMLQNHIFICDIVGQRILKVCRDSRVSSNFQFSDFGILGLPYWLTSPLETVYATNGGLWEAQIDHLQHFRLLPGRIDMQLNIDIPVDTELVEPLQEACIWRQARGAASEVSVIEDAAGSLDKVGVAQQWYDELDNLASSTPESELSTEHEQTKDSDLQDERIHFNCVANTSPGTSEVIIYTVLYLRLRRDPNLQQDRQEKYAARIVDILNSRRCGKIERDLWIALLLKSDRDLSDLIFMKPLHIRIKLDCLDHPKADNSRDYILTDSSIEVKISLDS